MYGYKLTHEQAQSLQGQLFAPDSYFNPVADVNDDYFIFSEEVEGCTNEDFQWVKNLPVVEYIAPEPPPLF